MSVKTLDSASTCSTISSRLTIIRCTCGKRLGRGRGFFELKCHNRKLHDGHKVLVFGEASAESTRILGITIIKDMPDGTALEAVTE